MAMVLAILRRDWAIERTYHLRMLLNFTDVAGLTLGIYFISRLVDDPAALADYGGNYFDFAVIGLAVTSFAGVGLGGFGESIVREQSTGTIELLLASPASPTRLMGGMFLFPFMLSVVQVSLLLGFGIGVVGSGIPLGGLALSVPILLLTTATFAAVGIAAAGVLILAKRGDPISGPFYQLSMLLSGAVFPIGVLPGFLEAISLALPATWGVRAVRELLLNDAGWRDVVPETLVLCAFTVVMLPLGLLVFRSCLASARRQGVLGSY
jgi:ABC-2 type transport system permease protein